VFPLLFLSISKVFSDLRKSGKEGKVKESYFMENVMGKSGNLAKN